MISLLLSIIGFVIVLSFLVIIHEIGHFVAARIFKIKVLEFGLGYPPKVKDLFRKWGTTFTLNWMPFGGFVRLAGEDRDLATNTSTQVKKSELFYVKPAWQRIIVLSAGAFMNFLFGIVAFSLLFTGLGIPEPRPLDQGVLITQISQGSPAEDSQLMPGDIIMSLLVADEYQPVESADAFIEATQNNAGSELTLQIQRNDFNDQSETFETKVYVRTSDEIPENDGAIGIGIAEETIEFIQYPWWQMPFRGAKTGLISSFDFSWAILLGLADMVSGMFAGVVPTDVAGPVGIAREVYKEKIFEEGILPILNFTAIISINLAIVNLLPIPALDGGRILTLLLEKIFGKAFKPVYEQYANAIGFFFLITLIILITIKDIGVIFSSAGLNWARLTGFLGG